MSDCNSVKEFIRLKKQRSGEIIQNKGNPMYLAQKGLAKSIYSKDLVDTKKIINDMMTYMESRNIWGRYGF